MKLPEPVAPGLQLHSICAGPEWRPCRGLGAMLEPWTRARTGTLRTRVRDGATWLMSDSGPLGWRVPPGSHVDESYSVAFETLCTLFRHLSSSGAEVRIAFWTNRRMMLGIEGLTLLLMP